MRKNASTSIENHGQRVSAAARAAQSGSSARRAFLFLLACGLTAGGVTSCAVAPPEGDPIDLEAMRVFKPFQLKDLAGEDRVLSDFLAKTTLVALFFPT